MSLFFRGDKQSGSSIRCHIELPAEQRSRDRRQFWKGAYGTTFATAILMNTRHRSKEQAVELPGVVCWLVGFRVSWGQGGLVFRAAVLGGAAALHHGIVHLRRDHNGGQ